MTIHQLCVEKVIILSWRTGSVIWVLVFEYYWRLWPTLGLPQDVQVCQGQGLPWPEIFDNSSSHNDQEQSVLSTTKNCQPTRICKTDLSHLEPIEGLEGANRIWETARKLKPGISCRLNYLNVCFTCFDDPINPDKERSTSSRPSR